MGLNWTAVAAIGQVLAALATVASLWMLWSQIRINRQQALEIARQSEEDRHTAVHPELILSGSTMSDERGAAELTYRVSNIGEGPAVDVELWYRREDDEFGHGYPSGFLPRDCHCDVTVKVDPWRDGEIILRWRNRLGRAFEKRHKLIQHGHGPMTKKLNPDGTIGRMV